jgi:hypothetical protein
MSHISSTSVSQQENAAVVLAIRRIKQLEVDRQAPRGLQTAANEFLRQIGTAAGRRIVEPFLPENLERLKNTMNGQFENENDFNEMLFATLRECLQDYEFKSDNPDFFLIKNANSNKFAIGFAREIRASFDPFPKKHKVATTDSTSSVYGLSSHFRQDHLLFLFEGRNGGPWQPLDCFAAVELKTDDTSCVEFPTNSVTHRIERPQNEEGDIQDTLAEVTLYNLECVLLYHGRRGKLPNELPLAIVACKKLNKKTQEEGDDDEGEQEEVIGKVSGEHDEPVWSDDKDYFWPAAQTESKPNWIPGLTKVMTFRSLKY